MFEGLFILLKATLIIAAIAITFFVFLGPFIELLMGIFLPVEALDKDNDDDTV